MSNIESFNKALTEIMGLAPIVDLTKPLENITPEMKQGLAMFYGNAGLRDYIDRKAREALTVTAQRSTDLYDLAGGKMRALTLIELLSIGKKCYEDYQKILELNRKKNASQAR